MSGAFDLKACPADRLGLMLDLAGFNAFLDFVYKTLLKRAPDPDGRKHYHDLHQRGLSRAAIVGRLLKSREHRDGLPDAPGVSTDEYVRRAYQDVLGRWPDSDGLETYCRIASRWRGRARVIANLQRSEEAVRKGGGRYGRIVALRHYARKAFWLRLPVIGGFVAWQGNRALRIDRLELQQAAMAAEIALLRRQIAELDGHAESFSFGAEAPQTDPAGQAFASAFERARRTGRLADAAASKGFA